MTSEAQTRANAKWKEKKDRQRLYRYRSQARKFIRDLADKDDLLELQQMFEERLKEM